MKQPAKIRINTASDHTIETAIRTFKKNIAQAWTVWVGDADAFEKWADAALARVLENLAKMAYVKATPAQQDLIKSEGYRAGPAGP